MSMRDAGIMDGDLLAVMIEKDGKAKPETVFAAAS